jgi:hypothetical protein
MMNQEENKNINEEGINPEMEHGQENSAAGTPVEDVEDLAPTTELADEDKDPDHANDEESGEALKTVEAEDDHDAPKERKLEIPDYDHMEIDEALAVIESHIKEHEPARIKGVVETGRSRILMELNAEREKVQEEFLQAGGNVIDFYHDQPQRKKLGAIYGLYRDKLRSHYAALEKELAQNLYVKKEIIEEIKALPMADGSAKEKYDSFKTLREKWNATGLVPKEEARTVWANYNHHVDNFFDYLRLAYDLIEKDYQHNYDEKVALCQTLEGLADGNASSNMFRALQQAHSKWKRIGPVPREKKEELWERFKAVTAKIHEKRYAYNESIKTQNDAKIESKKAVVASIEALTNEAPTKHSGWQQASKKLTELRAEFKKIGFVKSTENDEVWAAYKEAQRQFNRAKNNFYKEEKKAQKANLDAKIALVELAKSVKDSEDIQETARILKKAQSDWKKTGYVNKKDGDRLWNEFRGACNEFFNRMNNSFKAKEAKTNAAVDAKKAKLTEFKDTKVTSLEDAIGMHEAWSTLGSLPGKYRGIEDDFEKILNAKLESLGLDSMKVEAAIFSAKTKAMVEADDQDGLFRQRNWLRDQMDNAKKELHQLENNIAFFANSKSNPLLDAAKKNIESQKARVEHLTALRKQFNSLLK